MPVKDVLLPFIGESNGVAMAIGSRAAPASAILAKDVRCLRSGPMP